MRPLGLLAVAGCAADGAAWTPPSGELGEVAEVGEATFAMGHPDAVTAAYGNEWKENELPPHDVTVSGFSLDVHEVTVELWARFLNDIGGELHHHPLQPVDWTGEGFAPRSGYADRPIHWVSWYDAATFCAWAGKRLPTEAEWELAAKGADDPARRYPWGWSSDAGPSCDRAVYFTGATLCRDEPQPVGARPDGAGPFGHHDLAGNVAEWVADWYDDYRKKASTDPIGPEEGTWKVLRGGGFRDGGDQIRVTARIAADPLGRSQGVGFRCASD